MKQFLTDYKIDLIGVTGTTEEIEKMAKNFKVYYNKMEAENELGDYNVDHSTYMFIMDDNGEFVKLLHSGDDVETSVKILSDVLEGKK